ncbi:MAG: YjbQ family protein [Dehalococcoidia bacterium]|nr:YjbQ family protein [Dehalococcoidia bacterium]
MAVDIIKLTAEKAPNFIDITDRIAEIIKKSDITNGLAVVFSKHTTAAIKINENEPELIKDMEMFLARLSPPDADYHHNNFDVRTVNMEEDECPNGHAHCQHLLLSASETIPVMDGKLQLGVWQRVFFVELDRPRERQVLIQVMGE